MSFREVFEESFVQLCIIFIFIVLLKELGVLSIYFINYKWFAYLIPIIGLSSIRGRGMVIEFRLSFSVALIFLFFILVGSRLYNITQTSVPLGYDPGIYKYAMEYYTSRLPEIPENGLPEWIRIGIPQGTPILALMLNELGSVNALKIIRYLFPLLCFIVFLPLYMLVKQISNKEIALIAAGLYALSYTQYTVYTFMYFKNVIGLILLLTALWGLERKNYVVLMLMYAGTGAYHRPEFLLLSIVLLFYVLTHRTEWKPLLLSVIVTGVLIAPMWIPRLDLYLGMTRSIYEEAFDAIGGGYAGSGGTFFDWSRYEWVSLMYLPFALLGFTFLLFNRSFNSLFWYFIVNTGIVVGKLFFYKRLIIDLDLLYVMLAAVGVYYTFLCSEKVPRKLGYATLALIMVSSGLVLANGVRNARPLITEKQLETIEWLAENTEENAFVLASSPDAPWVLGWSERKVIAPGMFHWNDYNRAEWMAFFTSRELNKTMEFLSPFEGPVYIYRSKNPGNSLGAQKFDNDCFEKIIDDEAEVYRYLCNGY